MDRTIRNLDEDIYRQLKARAALRTRLPSAEESIDLAYQHEHA